MVKRTDNSIWALSPRTKENAEVCAVDHTIAVEVRRLLARVRRNDGAPSAEQNTQVRSIDHAVEVEIGHAARKTAVVKCANNGRCEISQACARGKPRFANIEIRVCARLARQRV